MKYFSILLLIPCVCSFKYLSATVHSQDVKPIPKRDPWHPHLYLVHDEVGDGYEIRNSHEFYDVSVSFLETKESSPGVMNCECRFVQSDLTDEEDSTEFLQVITPNTQKRLEVAQQQEKERLKEIPIGVNPQFVQSTKPLRVDTRREIRNPQLIETNENLEMQKKEKSYETAKQNLEIPQENSYKRVEVPSSGYENNSEYQPMLAPRVFEAPKQHFFRDSPPPAPYYAEARPLYQPQVFQNEYKASYSPESYPPPQYIEERAQGSQYIKERSQEYAPKYVEERPPQYVEERPQVYQYSNDASQVPVYQDERATYQPQSAEYYDPRYISNSKVVYVYPPYP
ncbi:unnamed protein product [Blepharisma stoltei]|uniref:Uncharacterized protein n=1 Tax=Blepharisma stoltei TaxID=1481888 RepID=A0AAU9I9M5_9CILI|nr:unnamed protein product [Blepharisma stoltei]